MHVVINWLWQGGVVAIAAAVVLRVISLSRAQARYAAAWAAWAAVLVLPAAPLLLASPPVVRAVGASWSSSGPVLLIPVAWWTSTAVAVVLCVAWSSVAAIRLAAAAVALRRMKSGYREFPPEVEARLRHWSRVKTTGRRTRLVVSNSVASAAVLRGGSSAIAVAPALLKHLGDADLDRVVIHEWAHVQRRDDVAQLVQVLVSIAAGWHPALWWLDRQLHLEREVACDEIAVAVTGSAKGYATCLARVASLPAVLIPSRPALATSRSDLRRRIVRILATRAVAPPPRWRLAAVGPGALLVVVALTVGNLRVVEKTSTTADALTAAHSESANSVALLNRDSSPVIAAFIPASPPDARSPTAARRSQPVTRKDALPRPVDSATETMAGQKARGDAGISAPAGERPLDSAPLTWAVPAAPLNVDVSPGMIARSGVPFSDNAGGVTATGRWSAATDAAKPVGRGSRKAAVATAAFFTRFGRKIAGSF